MTSKKTKQNKTNKKKWGVYNTKLLGVNEKWFVMQFKLFCLLFGEEITEKQETRPCHWH